MENITVYTPADCSRILNDLRPKIGHYGWMFWLMKKRARKNIILAPTDRIPWRLIQLFLRVARVSRPYFICSTNDGILFVGHYQDSSFINLSILQNFKNYMIHYLQQHYPGNGKEFLDVGANVGIISMSMAKFLAGRSRVVAFEPIPQTACRAAASFALNRLENTLLFTTALGENDGSIEMIIPSGSEGASAFRHKYSPTEKGTNFKQQVRCTSLDRLMEASKIGQVGLIKIDVEGGEMQVIEGAKRLLARDRPTIVYEFNPEAVPAAGWKVNQPSDIIQEVGGPYRFEVIHQDDDSISEFPPPADLNKTVDIGCIPI